MLRIDLKCTCANVQSCLNFRMLHWAMKLQCPVHYHIIDFKFNFQIYESVQFVGFRGNKKRCGDSFLCDGKMFPQGIQQQGRDWKTITVLRREGSSRSGVGKCRSRVASAIIFDFMTAINLYTVTDHIRTIHGHLSAECVSYDIQL